MIIDFHTHAFPEKIAERAIDSLGKAANFIPLTNGTVEDLRKKLGDGGVDVGIVLPVVTKSEQFSSICDFALEINGDGNCGEKDGGCVILSFGGIHPDDEEWMEHTEKIKELGLKGIKLHPDFQGTYIDDEKYFRIIKKAVDEDLVVAIHAGVDKGFASCPVRCTPERAARLTERLLTEDHSGKTELPIVFAHGGGYEMHSDVMKYLAGKPVYIDVSMMYKMCSLEEANDLVRAHGAERMLFGTDCPWGDPTLTVNFVDSLKITSAEKELILHENAERLLNL